MSDKLNTYMGFSRLGGPQEGAILIFAHTSREAKKIGWGAFGFPLTDEYIDFGVNRLWKKDWLYKEAKQEKLEADIPHVNDNPKCCNSCETWGHEPIDENGLCYSCSEYAAAQEQEVEDA